MWSNAYKWVKSADEEKDLGVIMSKDLKFSKQCLLTKSKANLMLGIINRGVSYKSAEVISLLYTSYVRLQSIVSSFGYQ